MKLFSFDRAHRDACRQLETLESLECSLEEAYWNDMEVMDKIQELESELKVAHRKKTKSHHQISALHQLVSLFIQLNFL